MPPFFFFVRPGAVSYKNGITDAKTGATSWLIYLFPDTVN